MEKERALKVLDRVVERLKENESRTGEARDLFVAEICERIGVKASDIISDDISKDTAGFIVLLPGDPVGGYTLRKSVVDFIKEFEPVILLDTTEDKLAMSIQIRYKALEDRFERRAR